MGGHCLFPTILAGDKQWRGATLCFLLKHREMTINSVMLSKAVGLNSVNEDIISGKVPRYNRKNSPDSITEKVGFLSSTQYTVTINRMWL